MASYWYLFCSVGHASLLSKPHKRWCTLPQEHGRVAQESGTWEIQAQGTNLAKLMEAEGQDITLWADDSIVGLTK